MRVMHALRMRHAGFVVRNLERSKQFYCGLLGLTIYREEVETGDYIDSLVGIKNVKLAWVKLNLPQGGLLELLEYKSHPDAAVSQKPESAPSNRLGSGHVALTVSNLDELYKTLTAQGYVCNSPPLPGPTGKTKILYAHDPDGIILELVEDLT